MSENKYTTIDHVTSVENHDDLYRGHRTMFLESVLARSLPHVFQTFLDTWPNCKVKARSWKDGDFTYTIAVNYEHWTREAVFDAAEYYTGNKQTLCDQLDAFCREMSEKFLAEEKSGRPWWSDHATRWTYNAPLRIRDTQYTKITTILAEIKKRGNRFQWHLIPDKYKRDDWNVIAHQQGYASTIEDAKAVVEAARKENHVYPR